MSDTTPEAPVAEGWTWLHHSRKWHYFVGQMALCRRYMTLVPPGDVEQGNDDSADNCLPCKRALAARQAAALKENHAPAK